MPYKSNAQRKFFHAAEKRGDISPSTVEEFDQASKGKELPKKVGVGHAYMKDKKMGMVKKKWRGGEC